MAAVDCSCERGNDPEPAAPVLAACGNSGSSEDIAKKERSRSRSPRCSAAAAASAADSKRESTAESAPESISACTLEGPEASPENVPSGNDDRKIPGDARVGAESNASAAGLPDKQPGVAKEDAAAGLPEEASDDQPAAAKEGAAAGLPEEASDDHPAAAKEGAAAGLPEEASDDEPVAAKKDAAAGMPEEVLRQFVEENELDAAAEKALRDLPGEVQRKVLDEGPCSGSDKSATLERRIRRLADDSPERPAARKTGEAGSRLSTADLERFIDDNDLESDAAQVLREQPEAVQHCVVAEGVVTGRDKTASVICRVRRAKSEFFSSSARAEVSASTSSGRINGVVCSLETLERFIDEHDLDKYAESTLRSQAEDVQAAVIAEGPVVGDNKSKMVMGRIKRVQQAAKGGPAGGASGNCRTLAVQDGAPPPPPPGPPPAPGTEAFTRALQQQVHTGAYPMSAAAGMYGMPGYYGYQMPYGYYPQAYPPPGYGYPGPYGFGPPPGYGAPGAYSMPPGVAPGFGPPGMAPAVEDFARQNSLDGSALQSLREQPPAVQHKVVSEGFLSGKNKSAVLMSRIRRAAEQVSREMPQGSSRSRHEDPISAFIRENTLDTAAAQKLRDQPSDVQKRVLDEGPLTGSNRSAILIGRIRRIRETPF